jgi:hypothetical protein
MPIYCCRDQSLFDAKISEKITVGKEKIMEPIEVGSLKNYFEEGI